MKIFSKTWWLAILLHVPCFQACFFRDDGFSDDTLPAGSISTPKPPPAVSSACGNTRYYNEFSERNQVIGGQDAYINQYPWIARLSLKDGGLCGSSVISNEYLLTAAHCVAGLKASQVEVVLGDYDLTIVDEGSYVRSAIAIIVHPQYNSLSSNYDFALIRLNETLSFSNWVTQPICLPNSCDDGCRAGTSAYVAGWGQLSSGEGDPLPIRMQTGLMEIADHVSCAADYSYIAVSITDQMMCASGANGQMVDTCYGDSGGPMMTVEDGFYKICGMSSFGVECGDSGMPGVYARVCSVVDWIQSYI